MKIKNTFVQAKMNKDMDERLLPKGEYPHAENIRIANTEGADLGAIENSEGNEKLTNFNLTNAKTIGAFADGSNQKLYWFTTSDEKDLVLEYDILNNVTNTLLESTKPNSLLNFDKNYLITGVSKVINGDSDRDLLVWTDDLNPPRMINIERAKEYIVDGFIEEDISVIKKPPRFAPTTNLTFSPVISENNIEDKFLSFAYRYKYLDGEYSALSSYTNYNFSPSSFDLDYQTMENRGMVNFFNAIKVGFNTGSKRVTDIQLVFKESNSNVLSVIDTFNKAKEGWEDNEDKSFLFSNSKKYTSLPEDELFRSYDNVPKLAKSLEVIGNRLVFGNYVEGYDLINKFGQDVNIYYNLSLLSKDLTGERLTTQILDGAIVDDTFLFDIGDNELKKDTRLSFNITLQEVTYSNGNFIGNFDYILEEDYTSMIELSQADSFILFVGSIMTNIFLKDYTATPPDNSEIISTTPFAISAATASTISITSPNITYRIDNTPVDNSTTDGDFTDTVSNWVFTPFSEAFYKLTAINSSLKTNRSYEVGMLYLDEYNRATTVLTESSNTIYIPQEFSINQNKIVASLNHTPPVWADRYKFVVKQNKANYETIYTSIFYEDGLYRWVKLEGANVNKVKEGDTLIVKSDLSGLVEDIIKVRVLEVSTKQSDFITGNVTEGSQDIIEEAGLYMKIKPSSFDMNYNNNNIFSYDEYMDTKKGNPIVTIGSNTATTDLPSKGSLVGYFDDATQLYIDYEVLAGSRIKIKFRNYESDGYNEVYEKDFVVQSTHSNFQLWWEAEVINLGDKESEFNWEFIRNTSDNSLALRVEGLEDGAYFERSKLSCQVEVVLSGGIVIFETSPEDSDIDIYYETEQTFEIVDGYHLGNIQSQSTVNDSAIVELDFFNCYAQGNGAESYKINDAFNQKALNIDLRPTTTSIEGYKEVRRYADLTYSAPYNENSNLNGLNEFNLSLANYKEDIDKRYGYIQKLFSRDTDLMVFQEDKVSKVLYGKDLLMNADGSSNISSIEDVLGQQIAFKGEYGISRNPESFAFDGYNIYFTDAKRGAVLRLGNNGINEISSFGLRTFFRDQFKNSINNRKIGGFDPHNDQYVSNPKQESFFEPVSIKCGKQINRTGFSGELDISIDFGIKTGVATFNYNSNGVPLRYNLEWNGQTFTTGFVGDSSYNQELIDLGLTAVVGSGTGSFTFQKTDSIPTNIKINIEAPICDAELSFSSDCIETPQLKVVSVVLNDVRDNGLSMLSRYKWSTSSYSSPFKKYESLFGEGELDTYDVQIGQENSGFIPAEGSTVKVESFNGFNQTAEFLEENKIGYLVSNTEYTDAQIANLITAANFPILSETVSPNGDVSNSISFQLSRPLNEQFLYLIWDYRNPEKSINQDTKIRIYFDNSGSMNSTLAPLQTMRDTLLKDRLLSFYNNDEALYDASVVVENFTLPSDPTFEYNNERTLKMLNLKGETPEGNVISLIFQDEASPIYYSSTVGSTRTPEYDTDIANFRNRLSIFPQNYYSGVVFQVSGYPEFKEFITRVKDGVAPYEGVNGLSDKTEINYKFDITNGGTAQYYLDQIVNALTELGYEL